MVASGVPVPNGNLHAMEVSMMSLDLLAKILTFEIQVVDVDFLLCVPTCCQKKPTAGPGHIALGQGNIETLLTKNIVQHKPGSRLKLRMGMHSGRVVGGVVGTKIPHYSVFG